MTRRHRRRGRWFSADLCRGLAIGYNEQQALRPLAEGYVRACAAGASARRMSITGILLTYRAFDTLGEVAVLFMVAAAWAWFWRGGGEAVGRSTTGRLRPLRVRNRAKRRHKFWSR